MTKSEPIKLEQKPYINSILVATMIYGTEDIYTQIDEWKTFIESNSKFVMTNTVTRQPKLTAHEVTEWNGCYFIRPWYLDYTVIPSEVHIIMLLFKLLPGQEQNPCWGGGAWGGDVGIHGRPICGIPYNVWWWEEPMHHEGFRTTGAQIMVHEWQNALRWIVKDELGFTGPFGPEGRDPLPDPYSGECGSRTHAECYKYIFSEITDEMYKAIERMFLSTTTVERELSSIREKIQPITVTPLESVSYSRR